MTNGELIISTFRNHDIGLSKPCGDQYELHIDGYWSDVLVYKEDWDGDDFLGLRRIIKELARLHWRIPDELLHTEITNGDLIKKDFPGYDISITFDDTPYHKGEIMLNAEHTGILIEDWEWNGICIDNYEYIKEEINEYLS